MIEDLNDRNYSNFILSAEKVLFIDFYTPMCSACQELMPTLNMLDAHFKDEAIIARVDVSKSPKLAKKYSVDSVPLCVVVGTDKMVKEAELGVNIPEHYFKMIDRALDNRGFLKRVFRIF